MSFSIGQRVDTEKNGKGKVAFVGTTQFAEGEWIGVELDEPKGKNNGSVQGVQYFTCEANYGLFIKPNQLKPESSRGKPPASSALKAPSTSLRKDSAMGSASKLSPGSSPKMSPAASRENLSRTPTAPVKKGSSSNLQAASEKRRPSAVSTTKPPQGKASPSSSDVPRSSGIPARKESAIPKSESKPVETAPPPVERPTESVLERVKKMEEDSPLTLPSPLLPPGMDEGTELEYLKVQVKDLNEKLETLRMKRREDKDKLVEYERMKVQLTQLTEYKNKAQETHSSMLREIQEKKQEADVLREWKEAKQEEFSGASEDLEMALLDKEMAEEKAETLQLKCEELETRVEELEADVAILREEMGGTGGGIPEGNTVQMKQLQQQNERMREALVKLRDLNGNAVADKQSAEKEAETARAENAELLRMGEQWKKRCEEAEESVLSLKEQVDALMGSEEVVQHLSDKNLDMEEKIRLLEIDKEDLEAMRDMDEQIAEEQKQVEKDLRKEIEGLQITINQMMAEKRQDEAHAEKLSETIMKFRKKTAELISENEDFKDNIKDLEQALSLDKEDEKDRAGQASLAIISYTRTFALSVESKLRAIELHFAEKHIKYLKAFLPDNFSKGGGDNDCVQVSMIIPRLGEKAILLSTLLKEKFPAVTGGMRVEHVTKSHKGEQWAYVAKAAYVCAGIKALCAQIESGLSLCTVDRLASVSHLSGDFSVQERTIDNYLDLLKNNRLDENSSLDQLESCLRYLHKKALEEQLNGRDDFEGVVWTTHSLDILMAAFEWWTVNQQRMTFLVTSESSDVVEWVKGVGSQLANADQIVRRAKARLPSDDCLSLSESFFDSLTRALSVFDKVSSVLHDSCALAATQLTMLSGESSGFDSSRVKEMLHGVMEKSYGKTPLDRVFEPANKDVSLVMGCLGEVQKAIEEGLMVVDKNKIKKNAQFTPLVERAHVRKQAAAEAEGLRWQMEKKENEIIELRKGIKARIDDISNYKLRLEMADARMEQFSKVDSEKEHHLQRKIDQLVNDHKKKENDFDRTMDALNREVELLTAENKKLNERSKNMSKQALFQGLQNEVDLRSSPRQTAIVNPSVMSKSSSSDVAVLEYQLSEALSSLRKTTIEMRKAKVEGARVASVSLCPSVCGPFSLSSPSDPSFEAIEREAEHLQREEGRFTFFAANPLKSWKENEAARERWNKDRDLFFFRVNSCRNRLREYWEKRHPGEEVPSLMGIHKKRTVLQQKDLNIHSKPFKDICNRWGIPTV